MVFLFIVIAAVAIIAVVASVSWNVFPFVVVVVVYSVILLINYICNSVNFIRSTGSTSVLIHAKTHFALQERC